jgi:hypothetical protein
MKTRIPITATEIKEAREKYDIGLIEANRMVVRAKAQSMLERAETVEDLKPIIHLLLEGYRTIK